MTDSLENLTPCCRDKAISDTSDVHQILTTVIYEKTVVFDPKNIDTKNVREIKPTSRINEVASRRLGTK